MILENFIMLAAPSTRTKAYIQVMAKENLFPKKCYLMVKNSQVLLDEMRDCSFKEKEEIYFNIREPILFSLEKYSIPYEFVADDIHSEEIKYKLSQINETYIIYSGYGGVILKSHLFELNKKFIHVHAGLLPEYRGSTTAYYSLLNEASIAATAIFMEKDLDAGDILASGEFKIVEKNVDIDYIYEPYIRSLVLVKALKGYTETGAFISKKQSKKNANTYYIIHPVLKHIAILNNQLSGEVEK